VLQHGAAQFLGPLVGRTADPAAVAVAPVTVGLLCHAQQFRHLIDAAVRTDAEDDLLSGRCVLLRWGGPARRWPEGAPGNTGDATAVPYRQASAGRRPGTRPQPGWPPQGHPHSLHTARRGLWLGPSVASSEWFKAELAPIAGPEFTSAVVP
jgi:hypothetical protein